MLSNSALRKNARMQLKGNWGKPILVDIVYILIFVVISLLPVVGTIIHKHGLFSLIQTIICLLVIPPMIVGLRHFALKFKRGDKPGVGSMFEGFKSFWPSFGLYLWQGLWVFLWTLLLIIPGIVKGIGYSMSFFVLADNPSVGVRKSLNLSKRMTKGYKGKLFLLELSFIGWGLLSIITLGIGYLWVAAYMEITLANFYDELKKESIENGVCLAEEF